MGVVVNDFNLSARKWVQTGGYLCSLASIVYIAWDNETLERVCEEKWEEGGKERREGRKKTLQIRARGKTQL